MENSKCKINFMCRKLKPDGNGGYITCGSTEYSLSGRNTWVTICNGNKRHAPIKVLKRKIVCKGCGQFSYVHLDGSNIKDKDEEYTYYEINKLVRLTKEIQELNKKRIPMEGIDEPITN